MLRGLSPPVDDVDIRGQVGKSLVRSFASRIIGRLVERVRLAVDVEQGRLQPYSARPEHAAAKAMRLFNDVGTALIFVNLSAAPTVLVSRVDLELISVSSAILARKEAKTESTKLAQSLFAAAINFDPDTFVAGLIHAEDKATLVTVCPVVIDTRYTFGEVAWLELSSLKESPCYLLYHSAISTSIANLEIEQGMHIRCFHLDSVRGPRPSRQRRESRHSPTHQSVTTLSRRRDQS